jgi:YjbE family integral membrane protein
MQCGSFSMTLLAAATAALPHTPWEWCLAVLQIVLIDVVLAGDNAVVIALAVRQLEPKQRLMGILLGSGAAVLLRVALTMVAAHLLAMNYIKLVGGLLVFWIAVKLLRDNTGEKEEAHGKAASGLWSAVWLILIADITMSIDNVLAVGAASKGSKALLWFGLGLSIPLVVFTSNLLSKLMDRYAIIVWIGAAILGKVGGEMIVSDHLFFPDAPPDAWLVHSMGGLGAALVVIIGLALRKRGPRRNQDGESSNRT